MESICRTTFIFVINSNNNSANVIPLHHCGNSIEAQSRGSYDLYQPSYPYTLLWTVLVRMG